LRRGSARKRRTTGARRSYRGSCLALEQLESRQLLAVSPELIKDINTDPQSSYFDTAAYWNDRLYFSLNSTEFWITDGTLAGTTKLGDLRVSPQRTPNSPRPVPAVSGNSLFFVGRETTFEHEGIELWKTDGTPDGTQMVKNIVTASAAEAGPNFLPMSMERCFSPFWAASFGNRMALKLAPSWLEI
jgi:ELWxxDGT repeat protein